MTEENWRDPQCLAVGFLVNGDARHNAGDDNLLVLMNAADRPVDFALSAADNAAPWRVAVDTARPNLAAEVDRVEAGAAFALRERSLAVLIRAAATPSRHRIAALRDGAIDRLADFSGIESGYHDIAGAWHETSKERRKASSAPWASIRWRSMP